MTFAIYFYINQNQRQHFTNVVKKEFRSRYPDTFLRITTYLNKSKNILCTLHGDGEIINQNYFNLIADHILTFFPIATVFLKDKTTPEAYCFKRENQATVLPIVVKPKLFAKYKFIEDE